MCFNQRGVFFDAKIRMRRLNQVTAIADNVGTVARTHQTFCVFSLFSALDQRTAARIERTLAPAKASHAAAAIRFIITQCTARSRSYRSSAGEGNSRCNAETTAS